MRTARGMATGDINAQGTAANNCDTLTADPEEAEYSPKPEPAKAEFEGYRLNIA